MSEAADGRAAASAGRASADRTLELWANQQRLGMARVANSFASRVRGLLGHKSMPDDFELLVLPRAGWIHTFGMRFALDVAYLDRHDQILAMTSMKPWRLGWPRLKAKSVAEAPAGNFARWGLRVGDCLELRAGGADPGGADPDGATDDANPQTPATAGAVTLVATPIGNLDDLSPRARQTLASADLIACEDTRRTGRLLELTGITTPGNAAPGITTPGNATPKMICLNEHTEADVTDQLIAQARLGRQIAVVTDAGTPGISDPPAQLLQAAIAAGIHTDTIPGPSAVLAGLSLSGLDTQRFVFEGFLARSGTKRTRQLQALVTQPRTIVLFEAPHRVKHTLADLAELMPDRRSALARELTKLHQQVIRGPLAELAARAQAEEITLRGEFVIVIEGAPPEPETDDPDILAALEAELAGGGSKKDAIAAVSANLGVPRRRVYALAIGMDN